MLERARSVLSRLSSWTPRPVYAPSDSSTPRIFGFNAERDLVIHEVVSRVTESSFATSTPLDVLVNACATAEIQRLRGSSEAGPELERWTRLSRRLSRMTEQEQREALLEIVLSMAQDIAGNFDPRVYFFAQRIAPALIAGTMRPSALMTTLLDAGHGEMRRLVRLSGDFEILRSLAKIGTLVVVPTHCSNLDSLVIGEALDREGLPPLVYGAGKNLFTNPIISFFMHNLGAYRVDRRVHAELYKQVLKAYSSIVIERGYHSLFFPGGTRSRSGLVEQDLKLGLMGTAMEAFSRSCVRGRHRPIFVVPVTLNYATVLEAETLIDDFLKDKGKARYIIDDDEFSRISRWYTFFSRLRDFDAAVVMRVGAPLDPFGNAVDETGHSLAPDGRIIDPRRYVESRGIPTLDPGRDAAYTRELGRRLVDSATRSSSRPSSSPT